MLGCPWADENVLTNSYVVWGWAGVCLLISKTWNVFFRAWSNGMIYFELCSLASQHMWSRSYWYVCDLKLKSYWSCICERGVDFVFCGTKYYVALFIKAPIIYCWCLVILILAECLLPAFQSVTWLWPFLKKLVDDTVCICHVSCVQSTATPFEGVILSFSLQYATSLPLDSTWDM